MKGKNDMRIKRKIGALVVLGMFGIIAFGSPVTADLDNLIWLREDTGEDVSLSASFPDYDVGIGTDDPTAKLHVVGGVTIDSGDLNVDSGTLFVDESENRVGIGTTGPNGRLQIYGDGDPTSEWITLDPSYSGAYETLRTGDDNEGLYFRIGDSTFTHHFTEAGSFGAKQIKPYPNSQPYITITDVSGNLGIAVETGGNVGIGTTNPDQKLEVLATSTQLQLTYTDDTDYATFSVDGHGQLNIVTEGTATEAHICLIPLEDTASGVGIGTTHPDSFVEIQTLQDGPQFQITCIDDHDYATFEVTSSGRLEITTEDGDGSVGNIALMPDGNVGIGVLTPVDTLEILSTTTQLRLTNTDNIDYATFTVNNQGKLTIQSSCTDDTTEDIEISTGNFGSAIYIDDDTKRVGIGVNSPDNTVEILSTSTQLQLTHTDNNDYATFTVDDNGKLTIQTTGDDEDIEISTTNFDPAIYIDDDTSRIGIGVATPNEKLEVDGKIRANTGFKVGVQDGITQTIRIADETSDGVHQLIFTGGILTSYDWQSN